MDDIAVNPYGAEPAVVYYSAQPMKLYHIENL
jgi:hypothetical protein